MLKMTIHGHLGGSVKAMKVMKVPLLSLVRFRAKKVAGRRGKRRGNIRKVFITP